MTEMPASCMAYDEELSALVDEELSAEREAEVREHLAGCERCSHRLEALCNVDLELAGVSAPEVPGDLRARLAARIAADGEPSHSAGRARSAPPAPRRRATGGRVAALLAAAAALVLAVWVAVRSDAPVQPEVPVAQTPPAPREVLVPKPVVEPAPPERQVARQEPAPLPVVAGPPVPTPLEPAPAPEPEPELEVAEVGLPELGDLAETDVAILVEMEALEDLDVIANLDLLERFLALEAAGGAG